MKKNINLTKTKVGHS